MWSGTPPFIKHKHTRPPRSGQPIRIPSAQATNSLHRPCVTRSVPDRARDPLRQGERDYHGSFQLRAPRPDRHAVATTSGIIDFLARQSWLHANEAPASGQPAGGGCLQSKTGPEPKQLRAGRNQNLNRTIDRAIFRSIVRKSPLIRKRHPTATRHRLWCTAVHSCGGSGQATP